MSGWGAGILFALSVSTQGTPPHRPLSPEQLTAEAGIVGVATVLRTQPRLDPNGSVYTDARLQFQEVWKGVVPAGFVLTQFGGTAEGLVSDTSFGTYKLRPGERIAVFAAPLKGEYWSVVGLRQGLYHVSATDPKRVVKDTELTLHESRRGETTLDGLRRRVYAATGRALPEEFKAETAPPVETPEDPAPSESEAPKATSAPASAPADPGRSAGLWFALLLFLAMLVIGWSQWRRKTEAAG